MSILKLTKVAKKLVTVGFLVKRNKIEELVALKNGFLFDSSFSVILLLLQGLGQKNFDF